MGSGKGKTRRAKANTAVANSATTNTPYVKENPQKWVEFVKTTGVQDIKLFQYYLSKNGDVDTDADYEKIMTEAFADMITAEAITLPNQYTTEDFIFEVGSSKNIGNYKNIGIALKTKPELVPIFLIRHDINKETTMWDIGENDELNQIIESINYLLYKKSIPSHN